MPVAHWPELTGSLSPSAQHRTDLERKVDATSIFNATVRVAIGPPFRLITAPHQCLHAVQSVGDSPLAGELIGGQQSRGAEVSGHETGGEPTDWESWSQSWKHHHLLGLELHSAEEIQSILDLAELFAQASQEGRNRLTLLRGFTVANLFFENSTRTRNSFSLAAKRLGADTVEFSSAGSSTRYCSISSPSGSTVDL